MKTYLNFLAGSDAAKWISAFRSRIQTMFICGNGETVSWGSNDVIKPTATICQLEELASVAVAEYHNNVIEPVIKLLKEKIHEFELAYQTKTNMKNKCFDNGAFAAAESFTTPIAIVKNNIDILKEILTSIQK